MYSMSGCPCSAQFAYDFNRTVYSDEELRASIDFKQPWSASAHAPSNTTSCFHGEKECRFEKWLLCALDQGGIDKAFPLELCLDGACDGDFSRMTPCATQYENPDNDELMQSCAAAHGLDYNKLKQCATSSRGDDLLLADAQDFKKVYGLQGVSLSSFVLCLHRPSLVVKVYTLNPSQLQQSAPRSRGCRKGGLWVRFLPCFYGQGR